LVYITLSDSERRTVQQCEEKPYQRSQRKYQSLEGHPLVCVLWLNCCVSILRRRTKKKKEKKEKEIRKTKVIDDKWTILFRG